jgi:hypothetical protein
VGSNPCYTLNRFLQKYALTPNSDQKKFLSLETSNVLIKKERDSCQDLYGKQGRDLPITALHAATGRKTFCREDTVNNIL